MKKRNLILGLAIFSLANLGLAQTLYWDGGTVNITTNGDGISDGASGTWDPSIQNWDQGAGLAEIGWPSGANAVFAAPGIAAGAGVVTIDTPITANSITVNSANYFISDGGNSANTLTLNAVENTAAFTIGANVVNSTGFTLSGVSTLILTNVSAGFTAPITINGGTLQLGTTAISGPTGFGNVVLTAPNSTLSLQSPATVAFGQTISGAGGVVIQNASSSDITTLSAANPYTNTTVINQATLAVGNLDETDPNCDIGTGPLQIGNGPSLSQLDYDFNGGTITTARPLIFGGNGVSTIENLSSGTLTVAGPVSFAASVTTNKIIGLSGTVASVLASSIPDDITATTTNSISLEKESTGTWQLTASNSFSGGLLLSGGNTDGALIISNDNELGATSGGIVNLNSTTSTIKSTNFPVVINAARTITYSGTTSNGTVNFVTGDTNDLTVAALIIGTNGIVQRASSSYTFGTVHFVNDQNNYGEFESGYGNIAFTSVANLGSPSALGSGDRLAGYNLASSTSAVSFNYEGTNNDSTTRPILWASTTGPLSLGSINTGTVAYLSSAPLKTGAGAAGGNSGRLTLTGTSTGTNTLAQVINNNTAPTSVIKSGTGNWILSGVNTYTGSNYISGGNLVVSSDANLGADPAAATPNNLSLDGGALSASATFTLNANRGIELGAIDGFGILDVASGMTLSYGGIITDATGSTNSGALVKTSAGTLALSGVNTYTGDTTISNGTLALTGSGSFADSTNIFIEPGATLDVSGVSGGYSLAAGQTLQAVAGAPATVNGSLNVAAAAVEMTNAVNTATIVVTGGSLTLGGGAAFTVNVNNGGTPLGAGSYKLVASGAGGSVAGTVPSAITVGGDGLAAGATASLSISNNALYLVVTGLVVNPPVVSGLSVAAGQAVLSFSGTSGQAWAVLSSTNLALPLASWTSEATGTFNGSVVNYTNASPNTDPQRFYIISTSNP